MQLKQCLNKVLQFICLLNEMSKAIKYEWLKVGESFSVILYKPRVSLMDLAKLDLLMFLLQAKI